MPPSVDEWLPDDHLARLVVEVIDKLDLSELVGQYAGRGLGWVSDSEEVTNSPVAAPAAAGRKAT